MILRHETCTVQDDNVYTEFQMYSNTRLSAHEYSKHTR